MEVTKAQKKYFTHQLTAWHATENTRSLPWKNEQDPYKIWLSEIILQQTRALQGLPYYLRFTETYPTVADMAAAKDEDAFRIWQGLGYYNRCKNMLATARIIAGELGGKFPDTYEGLLQLKGIGPYTAAAIASFAYGRPNAVVDGNVYRVLARFFGIDAPYDATSGKKIFADLAQELLDKKESAQYNQAIMDLGATVCTPRNPICDSCPLQRKCTAYHGDLVDVLPVKSKKLIVKKRYFNYLLLQWKDTVWIHKRTERDIWENLHEPYLIENKQLIDIEEITQHTSFKKANLKYTELKHSGDLIQRLTHQLIHTRFFTITLSQKPDLKDITGAWMNGTALKNTAFPKTLVSFLENNLYF